ncbi:MAG: glycosyltransferase family 4 protein [Calothrix sp. SM1_7_51]|nr:glycosyltransferase family 4 protein [Calothrix sp. SM1_7_51]
MRLVLVLAGLSCGGAERCSVLLAEGFLKKGHQVTVVTIYGEENDFYRLPENAKRVALRVSGDSPTLIHALWNNIFRLWQLRKAICSLQADTVISFLDITNILTLLALTNTSYPVFVSEQNNPLFCDPGKIWNKLRFFTYKQAARVVSSSQGVDKCFDWLPKTKRAVIYNPLTKIEDGENLINLPPGANLNKKWVIAMGRLTRQKGFDILLSAFKKIYHKYTDWQLIILGEGELRHEIENIIDSQGLNRQVILPGVLSNPFPILKRSELFVLSSRFEGFGNVLIEAKACGLPVISTDCPSGPKEIIRHGVDGILVANEDASALASAMDALMSDKKERLRLGANALDGVQRFNLENIVDDWEALITEVVKEKQK